MQFSLMTIQGSHGYIHLIENHSSWHVLLDFKVWLKTNLTKKIKFYQCDGEGEFHSNLFLLYLQQYGIQQQVSCLGTLE